MFKGLGTWLGLESPAHVEPAEEEEEEEKKKEVKVVEAQEEVNKQQQEEEKKEEEEEEEEEKKEAGQEQQEQEQESVSGKGLGDYFFSFASSASKKISESVVETAQTIKKTVEEGKIDGIIDKTFLGDFQKEQEKFVQEKKAKKSEAAVPPWVGYNEEETIQQQILSLSADKRNFLRDPPAGVQFHFEMEHMYPLAAVMLEEDELLNRMRFDLVPKLVKEEVFWRNYFYRVSLIKQSAQLTALAAQQQKDSEDRDRTPGVTPEDAALPEVRQKTPPVSICSLPEPAPEEEEISTSPGVSEFVSDGFETTPFNQEDLWKEMEQMVLDLNGTAAEVPEESSEWGKEMLQELQDYEMVPEEGDDQLQQELENILSAEEIRDINLSLNG